MNELEDNASNGISRRTVTKAMAWAVPAIAVAVSVPTVAASPRCIDSGICFGGVKIGKDCGGGPNTRKYWACVTFTNNSVVDVTVSFNFVLVTSANGSFNFAGGGLVGANATGCFLVEVFGEISNCSNGNYAAFALNFEGGGSSGTANVAGGSTGGNEAPICIC